MDRREFLARAGVAATWAGIAIRVSACGDESDTGTAPGGGGGGAGGVTGVVSVVSGHSHSGSTVTDAQLMAGNAVMLTLTGAGHTHIVSLTAGEVMDIAAGAQVVTTSTNDSGHAHTVTFN